MRAPPPSGVRLAECLLPKQNVTSLATQFAAAVALTDVDHAIIEG